jgi:hypothetical protein
MTWQLARHRLMAAAIWASRKRESEHKHEINAW